MQGNRIILEESFSGVKDKIIYAVEELLSEKYEEIIIDMNKVVFIDSIAIGYLVKCHKNCVGRNASLILTNFNSNIRRSIVYAGLADIFKIEKET